MRVDVKKFLFVGTSDSRDRFFKKAQDAGIIHFIQEKAKLPEEFHTLVRAAKIVKGMSNELETESPLDTARSIIALKEEIDALHDEERTLKHEMARIQIFGDFSLDDINYIQRYRQIRFYCSKKGAEAPEELIYIDSAHGFNYYVGILKDDTRFPGMIEMKIEKPLGELQARKREIALELKEREKQLRELSRYRLGIRECLDAHNLQTAKDSSVRELAGGIFTAVGFVPLNKLEELKKLDIFFEEIAIEENDRVPTFLDNTGASKLGEDLVHIYDTPGPDDRDPSLFVLISFALFFAMIVGDAGYGLVLLGASLWLKFFKETKDTKRAINLSLILFSCCIVWGTLTTSFFGVSIPMLEPFSLTNYLMHKKGVGDSQGIMVEIALTVGIVHILTSLIRYMDRNYTAFGWSLFVVGAYFYFPEYLQESTIMHYLFHFSHESLKINGIALMAAGMSLAVAAGIYANRWLGLLEAMTVIQIFSDVLSYLRLYALALAGGIVSETINGFASSTFFVAGIFILLIGHAINIVLAIMGGVIHGLRLNFLEWYHYSFTGGGTPFIPLKKIDQ